MRRSIAHILILSVAVTSVNPVVGAESPLPRLRGSVEAVYELIERVLPGSSLHFSLSFINASECQSEGGAVGACFRISDAENATTAVYGTSASELSAGVGFYLREYCGMTVVSG